MLSSAVILTKKSGDGFQVMVKFALPNKFSDVDGILLSRKY